MATNRAFFSQDLVGRWLAAGHITLEGDVLACTPNGPAFRLSTALLFVSEVASGDDTPRLCGKVKTLAAVEELSGEHAPGSVVLGDHAYEVVDGFLGELMANEAGVEARLTVSKLATMDE
jgi:hypothetical protein